jgi:hypothetical protein
MAGCAHGEWNPKKSVALDQDTALGLLGKQACHG